MMKVVILSSSLTHITTTTHLNYMLTSDNRCCYKPRRPKVLKMYLASVTKCTEKCICSNLFFCIFTGSYSLLVPKQGCVLQNFKAIRKTFNGFSVLSWT
jgi:hypothetical protein